jgi:hypothetical protein
MGCPTDRTDDKSIEVIVKRVPRPGVRARLAVILLDMLRKPVPGSPPEPPEPPEPRQGSRRRSR